MRASISQIKTFKACRRAWELNYKEKLIPVQVSEPLETGKSYHKFIEELEHGYSIDVDFSKACAMAKAFEKYILPQISVRETEEEYEKQIGAHILHGFVDGIADDGCIIEHKTTSKDIAIGGEYEYGLLWDEQILAYMSLTGSRKVYYTVCRKPTIRIKKDETEEQFYERMVAWYDEDTDTKIRLFTIERTDEEVAQFEREFESICAEMEECNTGSLMCHRNTLHCSAFGRRCEYASICLHYDPEQNYIEFTRKEAIDGAMGAY